LSSKSRFEHQVFEKIKDLIESLEYGIVQITVHDSQVTQIERIEKYRFPLQAKSKAQK
jgi:hypothetical protein